MLTEEERAAITARLIEQIAMSKGPQPKMDCADCLEAMPIRFTYKCLYCGLWFCESCAEMHFGMTRAAWLAENS